MRTRQQIISAFRELGPGRSKPHGMTFIDCPLSERERIAVEKQLDEKFSLWWDTWIKPLIDDVEAKLL